MMLDEVALNVGPSSAVGREAAQQCKSCAKNTAAACQSVYLCTSKKQTNMRAGPLSRPLPPSVKCMSCTKLRNRQHAKR